MTTGEKVHVFRKIRNMSREDLAKQVGTSPNLIASIEANSLALSERDVQDFARALGVLPSDIRNNGERRSQLMQPDPELMQYCKETLACTGLNIYAALAAIDTEYFTRTSINPDATHFVPPVTYKSRDMAYAKTMLDILAVLTAIRNANQQATFMESATAAIEIRLNPETFGPLEQSARDTAICIAGNYWRFLNVPRLEQLSEADIERRIA